MNINQLKAVFADEDLKGNEKLLMLAIACDCNDNGVCFPSWQTLMTKTGMSRGSISKWLNILEAKCKIFRRVRNKEDGSRTTNKYLIYPESIYHEQ